MSEKIAKKITDLTGHTPLLELSNTEKKLGLKARLLAKLEYLNPAGSIKDRVAKAMIDTALKEGKISKNTVIIEPTSGNTGIGLASVAACYGMRCILTMPETMSVERRQLLKAYGAEIVLTEGSKGMMGAVEKANEMAKELPDSFIPAQFDNPVNAETHFKTTGPEIWEQTEGSVDIFIAGVGTGGTITGTGKFLKSKKESVKVIAVEPASSPLLSEGHAGPHQLQGIGANFIPSVLDTSIYDSITAVKNEDAFEAGKSIAKTEGVLVGISSGAALWAAIQEAKKEENSGKTIVVIFPDTGDRYLSTPMFNS
ncbi:MAG: cysteine synthase A [Treponema sp.]|nr:cysteine synthase A [Treponema sp.]